MFAPEHILAAESRQSRADAGVRTRTLLRSEHGVRAASNDREFQSVRCLESNTSRKEGTARHGGDASIGPLKLFEAMVHRL